MIGFASRCFMRFRRALGAVLPAASMLVALGASVPAAAGDAIAVQIGTFVNPVYVAVAPGQPRLLFIVERAGRIIVLQDEIALPHPFLDVRNRVFGPPDTGSGGEQGLFSVAFPANYATTGRFYIAFTNANQNIQVDEYRRLSHVRADVNSRRIVMIVPHTGAPQNHNGGQLQFGPDGFLYISTGDGGSLSPPGEPARNLENLLGKILRIDPLPTATRGYGIPSSNPFVGGPGRDEIYAYGLRNPWRFSFDGDRIAIADVGQRQWEEVNFDFVTAASGANFGWPQFEGDVVFDNTRPGAHPPSFPILTYDHGGGRCAIIGGYVISNPSFAALYQRYVYGDTCTGEVRSFFPDVGTQEAIDDRSAGLTLPGLASFGLGFRQSALCRPAFRPGLPDRA